MLAVARRAMRGSEGGNWMFTWGSPLGIGQPQAELFFPRWGNEGAISHDYIIAHTLVTLRKRHLADFRPKYLWRSGRANSFANQRGKYCGGAEESAQFKRCNAELVQTAQYKSGSA